MSYVLRMDRTAVRLDAPRCAHDVTKRLASAKGSVRRLEVSVFVARQRLKDRRCQPTLNDVTEPLSLPGCRRMIPAPSDPDERDGVFRLRRALASAMASALVCLTLVACPGSDDDDPDVTVPRSTSSTSTTIDVTTVPDEITIAYAQAVMDELDRVLGDAIRELVAAGAPSDRFVALLRAVYDEPTYSNQESLYGEDAANDFIDYDEQPDGPTTIVTRIVDASSTCVVVGAERSFERLYRDDPREDAKASYIQLLRKDATRDPGAFNPTPWAIVADYAAAGASIPEDPCK